MGVLVRRVFEALVKGSPWGSIVLSLVSQCSYACFSSVNKNVSEGVIKCKLFESQYLLTLSIVTNCALRHCKDIF